MPCMSPVYLARDVQRFEVHDAELIDCLGALNFRSTRYKIQDTRYMLLLAFMLFLLLVSMATTVIT